MSISDERLAALLADANALIPNERRVTVSGSDVLDLRSALSELQTFRAAAKVRANSDGDGAVRKVAVALDCLRHLDDEIRHVPSKPDPVTVNNLTYWAAQLRAALASIPATGGEKAAKAEADGNKPS